MDFDLTQRDANVVCVRLRGRLDSAGADSIGTRFTAAVVSSAQQVVVDLSGLSFLASMGIRLFISSARALAQQGGRLVMFGAPEMVQTVLDHVALDQMIPIVATETQALERLARP
jgi:anti-anti-sigma factor